MLYDSSEARELKRRLGQHLRGGRVPAATSHGPAAKRDEDPNWQEWPRANRRPGAPSNGGRFSTRGQSRDASRAQGLIVGIEALGQLLFAFSPQGILEDIEGLADSLASHSRPKSREYLTRAHRVLAEDLLNSVRERVLPLCERHPADRLAATLIAACRKVSAWQSVEDHRLRMLEAAVEGLSSELAERPSGKEFAARFTAAFGQPKRADIDNATYERLDLLGGLVCDAVETFGSPEFASRCEALIDDLERIGSKLKAKPTPSPDTRSRPATSNKHSEKIQQMLGALREHLEVVDLKETSGQTWRLLDDLDLRIRAWLAEESGGGASPDEAAKLFELMQIVRDETSRSKETLALLRTEQRAQSERLNEVLLGFHEVLQRIGSDLAHARPARVREPDAEEPVAPRPSVRQPRMETPLERPLGRPKAPPRESSVRPSGLRVERSDGDPFPRSPRNSAPSPLRGIMSRPAVIAASLIVVLAIPVFFFNQGQARLANLPRLSERVRPTVTLPSGDADLARSLDTEDRLGDLRDTPR